MFHSPFPPFVSFVALDEHRGRGMPVLVAEAAILADGVVEERRRAFHLGRAAAGLALRRIHAPAPVLRGADRAPVWPPGIVGTITHAAGWAAAAVARGDEVAGLGLDIEDTARPVEAGVARLVGDDAERAWIGGDADRLVRLFSAKEALFKAIYPLHGAFFGFQAAHLEWEGEGFVAELTVPLGDSLPAGSRFPVSCQRHDSLVMTGVLLPCPL